MKRITKIALIGGLVLTIALAIYASYPTTQAWPNIIWDNTLFQGDVEAWKKWNKLLVRQLKTQQQADGSIPGQHGAAVSTSLSLLALALNYRLLPIYER